MPQLFCAAASEITASCAFSLKTLSDRKTDDRIVKNLNGLLNEMFCYTWLWLFPCGLRCCCTTSLETLWERRRSGRNTRVTCSQGWLLVGCTALRSSHTAENWPITCRRSDGLVSTNSAVVCDTLIVWTLTANIVFVAPAPEPPTHLSVKQGPTNDTIELSWWRPASGDYDNFSLQWTPPDRLSVTQMDLTSRILGGMFPGRVYNFTLVTISGGGARGGPTVMSQPIQRNVRTSRWKTVL